MPKPTSRFVILLLPDYLHIATGRLWVPHIATTDAGGMLATPYLLIPIAGLCALCLSAPATAEALSRYSIHTGSFVFHLYDPTGHYTQYFQNDLFAVERRFGAGSDYGLYAGTLINSRGNRCAMLGMEKVWQRRGNWALEGIYVYTGEFFFDAFSHCGDAGVYRDHKKVTGIGYAPYIYHGVNYHLTPYLGLRAGIILPAIAALSVQLTF